jgi:hypothetical protein
VDSADILHRVAAGERNEGITGEAVMEPTIWRRTTGLNSRPGSSSAAVEHLTHLVLVRLPGDFIQSKGAHACVDGIKVREVKQYFFMGATGR